MRGRRPLALSLVLIAGCAGPQFSTPAAPPPESAAAASAVVPAAFTQPAPPAAPKPGAEPPPPPDAPPPLAGSPASVGGPLALDEVLDSVERSYPLLRAVEQERAVAGGRLVSSMGVFDLNLLAGADGQGTTYDNFRGSAGVSQGLPVGGVGLFAGYRNGHGEFTTYNLGQKTADGGEFRAGVSLPLWRDREIDRPRATVQQAQLDVRLAEPVIERQRLDFHRAAARTYWNWVAAGQRLRVVDGLLKLAVERDEQLRRRVREGAVRNLDRIDNQQNIALRNGFLVQAQRGFQQAAIDLSLFLRDGAGQPTLAGPDRLPAFPTPQPVDPQAFDAALRTAFELRPEPRRLLLQRDKVTVEYRLAANQTLPAVNAVVAGAQDAGPGKSSLSGPNGLDRATLSGGLTFQLPVERRDARGRIQTAQAQLAQLDQQLRNAQDVIRAEVQDTFSALERAYEFYQQATKRVELARQVARAERAELLEGRSDVLRVTLREQAAFEAEIIELGAQQDYFRALADFRVATGVPGR